MGSAVDRCARQRLEKARMTIRVSRQTRAVYNVGNTRVCETDSLILGLHLVGLWQL